MSEKNKHIYKALEDYCNLAVEPEYAVLLKGSWGCGKSHFVEEFINQNNQLKFLTVSLYGVNSVDAIEDKFFQQLNPVLSNKKMVLAGKIGKGLLKGTLKIDLDDDGKAEGSAKVGVPDIKLTDYLTNTSDCILVFDDLERCSMELNDILGYINYFVEKDGYKVIVIADEDKLIGNETEDNQAYSNIKEKLFGKTLCLEPDFEHVYTKFINQIIDEDALRNLLISNLGIVSAIFIESGYSNYRSLRKAIIEFQYFYSHIDSALTIDSELASNLLQFFVALSIEIYAGTIEVDELKRCLEYSFGQDNDKTKKRFSKIEAKYTFNLSNTLVSPSIWQTWFSFGVLDPSQLNEELNQYLSIKMETKQDDDIRKIFNFVKLESSEFEHIKQYVWEYFVKEKIREVHEIFNIVKLYLFLSEFKQVKYSICDVIEKAKVVVSNLAKENRLDLSCLGRLNKPGAELGDWNIKEVDEFNIFLNEEVQKQLVNSKQDEIALVIDAIKNNLDYFSELMTDADSRESYVEKPILHGIRKEQFLEILGQKTSSEKSDVFKILQQRYLYQNVEHLEDEIKWFHDVVKEISKRFRRKSTFDNFVLYCNCKKFEIASWYSK